MSEKRKPTAKELADAKVRAVRDGWHTDTAKERRERIEQYRKEAVDE